MVKMAVPDIILPPRIHVDVNDQLGVTILERRSLPTVCFKLVIWSGASGDSAGKEGLHRCTAKLLTKGTGTYSADDFASAIESIGGAITVQVSYDAVNITGQFLSKDVEFALDLLADIINDPVFQDVEIDRLRKKTVGSIKSLYDQPAQLCSIIHNSKLFPEHPYGRPVAGTIDSVNSICRDDIVRLYSEGFLKCRMQLTVAGDVDSGRILKTDDLHDAQDGAAQIPQHLVQGTGFVMLPDPLKPGCRTTASRASVT